MKQVAAFNLIMQLAKVSGCLHVKTCLTIVIALHSASQVGFGAERNGDDVEAVPRVILDSSIFARYPDGIVATNVEGYWTPKKQHVDEADSGLRSELEGREKMAGENTPVPAISEAIRTLSTNRRQYIGFIRDGDRYVQINSVPVAIGNEDWSPEWQTKYIFIFDGGPSFWRVNYNLTSKKYTDLRINESP